MDKETLINWSEGNPGALTFLMSLYGLSNQYMRANIFQKLTRNETIRGANLYVLWSDLCGRDMRLVEKICNDCPDDVLSKACSKQDYSGRELIKFYF